MALHDRTGKAVPAILSAGRVRLEPGASGGTTLRIDRAGLAGRHDLFEGRVTATNGDRELRRAVMFSVDAPAYPVTVTATARPGMPLDRVYAQFSITNLDDISVGSVPLLWIEAGKPVTVNVPTGRYSIMGSVRDADPATYTNAWAALAGNPDVAVNGATSVVLDAAAANKVTGTVEGVDTFQAATGVEFRQNPRVGLSWWQSVQAWQGSSRSRRTLGSVPMRGLRRGAPHYGFRATPHSIV